MCQAMTHKTEQNPLSANHRNLTFQTENVFAPGAESFIKICESPYRKPLQRGGKASVDPIYHIQLITFFLAAKGLTSCKFAHTAYLLKK